MEPLYLDFNKTLEGELDRIRKEIHEDLREPLLVKLDIIQNIILNIHQPSQTLLMHLDRDEVKSIIDDLSEAQTVLFSAEFPRAYLKIVKCVTDQVLQELCAVAGNPHPLFQLLVPLDLTDIVNSRRYEEEHIYYGVQRCPHIVGGGCYHNL